MKQYVIALDQGTTSSRAILFDREQNIIAMGQKEFPTDVLKEEFQDVTTIMGSVDTKLMIQANPKKVYERAKETLLQGRDAKKGYILGTSCETPPYTIPGQLLALTRAARDFGTYGTW